MNKTLHFKSKFALINFKKLFQYVVFAMMFIIGTWQIQSQTIKTSSAQTNTKTANNLEFTGGDGSENDPYQISTWEQLSSLQGNSYYVLINNLDKNTSDYEYYASASANSNTGWRPLLTYSNNIDGQGFVISDLVINITNYTNNGMGSIGLFSSLRNSVVQNLGITNINIIVDNYQFQGDIGGLAGSIENSTISNSYSIGIIIGNNQGQNNVGGLVGRVYNNSFISNSYSTATVKGNNNVGGLIGILDNSTVSNSHAVGSVFGIDSVGGLIGHAIGNPDPYSLGNSAAISNCYAIGSVVGSNSIGGLIGLTDQSNISKSYADVTLTGISNPNNNNIGMYMGGLIGSANSGIISNSYALGKTYFNNLLNKALIVGRLVGSMQDGAIDKCYTTVVVNINFGENSGGAYVAGSEVGLAVGYSYNNIFNSFWDTGKTDQDRQFNSNGDSSDSIDMRKQSTFENMGWDFYGTTENDIAIDPVWKIDPLINNGYPIFYSKGSYSIGSGTLQAPYPIVNWKDLDNIRYNPKSYFKLMNNLDQNTSDYNDYASESVDDYKGWLPIANFSGNLDGQGFEISNLTVNRYDLTNAGLFGTTNGATIKNIGLNAISVHGGNNVGGLAGSSFNTTITNSYISTANKNVIESQDTAGRSITGNNNVGGLLGFASNSIVSETYAKGSVNGQNYVGGLIGSMAKTTVSKSYTNDNYPWIWKGFNIRGNSNIGGLVGRIYNMSTIQNCYSASTIYTGTADNDEGIINVGGLVGSIENSTIDKCHSSGMFKDNDYSNNQPQYNIEKLIGINLGNATITNSFWYKFDNNAIFLDKEDDGVITQWSQNYLTKNIFIDKGWDFAGAPANGVNSKENIWTINLSSPDKLDFYPRFNNTVFSGGEGTSTNPFLISTWEQLQNIRFNKSSYFKLVNNLDATSPGYSIFVKQNTGQDLGWKPLGNPLLSPQGIFEIDGPFTGNFDGQGFVISDLFINRPSPTNEIFGPADPVGLFGTVSNAVIKNVGLSNCFITGYEKVGALIGSSNNSTISKSYVNGNGFVSGTNYIGGLIGSDENSNVSEVYTNIGVNAGTKVGGIIGSANYSTLSNSYTQGSVNGNDFVGGLVGILQNSTVEKCYAKGFVLNSSNSGGLTGVSITSSINDSFWDTQTTGQQFNLGGGTGKTTDEIQNKILFTDAHWDFAGETINGTTDIWNINTSLNGDPVYPTFNSSTSSGGDGSSDNPYQITNWEQLNNIRFNSNLSYKLMNNLDANTPGYVQFASNKANPIDHDNDSETPNQIQGWNPINTFTGIFDGQGFVISDLFIDRPGLTSIGLFGRTSDAHIQNLGLKNCNIIGSDNTGGLIGESIQTIVSNCFVTGSVKGNNYVGGLIGHESSNPNSPESKVISRCYTDVIVNGADYVGGLVGVFTSQNPYDSSNLRISNSYSLGNVTGNSNVAGLVGVLMTGQIENCYSAARVAGNSSTSGLASIVGDSYINNCYYDSQASGQPYGNTTIQMQTQSTFYGWDFVGSTDDGLADIWVMNPSINNGYPVFNTALYSGGNGTEQNPYLITSWGELNNVRLNLTSHYKLVNNLDKNSDGYNTYASNISNIGIHNGPTGPLYLAQGWEPIGNFDPINTGTTDNPYFVSNPENTFRGTFDGNGKTISDLYINRPGNDQIGLFGQVGIPTFYQDNDGLPLYHDINIEIKNIGLLNCSITGKDQVGSLVGFIFADPNSSSIHATVSNCSISEGSVTGRNNVGGLIGKSNSEILRSFSNVSVKGSLSVGGLLGESFSMNNTPQISNCYSLGTVFGDENLGGFIGNAQGGDLNNSYAAGLVKYVKDPSAERYIYGPNLDYPNYIGGLIGNLSGSGISNLFWDMQTSHFEIGDGSGVITEKGIGLRTSDMKNMFTYTSYFTVGDNNDHVNANWDFANTWSISSNFNNGYPNLRGETDVTIWNGNADNLWSNDQNWSKGVPNQFVNAWIASAGQNNNPPVLDVDFTVAPDRILTISDSGTLTIAAAKTLTIEGTTNFGNKSVIILSNASGTGAIGKITGSLQNATNVTVEHYIAQGKRAYNFLTPSVTTTNFIKNNWQLDTQITGSITGANGFDATITGSPSMYIYNNKADDQLHSLTGWNAISNTYATNLIAGMGYRMLIRGNRNVDLGQVSTPDMNAAITLKATGAVKTGNVVFNTASSPAINNTFNTTTNGFSLLGNPYVSIVDWNALSKDGLSTAYYGFDTNLGTDGARGKYVAYDSATGVSNDVNSTQVGRYIQSGQAFFVKNTTLGTPGTLIFNESSKGIQMGPARKASTNKAIMRISIYDPNTLALNGRAIDATVAVFGSDFSNDLGIGDVEKLMSSGENLGLSRKNKILTIEALAPVATDDELAIKTTSFKANNSYTFKINSIDFGSDVKAYLKDMYLNTQKEIDLSSDTFVAYSTNSDVNSYGEDRFKIVFANKTLANNTFETSSIMVFPNPVTSNQFNIQLPESFGGMVTIKLYNILGQEVYAQKSDAKANVLVQPNHILEAGIYVLSIDNQGKTFKQKIIIN